MANPPIIRSAFSSPADEFDRSGRRPVVFDILGPDQQTSLLGDLKLVLHANPTSMQWSYQKVIERVQTRGGWVEFHWGSSPTSVSFESVTGGFVRLGSGLSNVTGPGPSNELLPPSLRAIDTGGTRRETISYEKYLDLLALFYFNGSIYDSAGNIAYQGSVRITYDGGTWDGWFVSFKVTEAAEKPYQFSLSAEFTVNREHHRMRSTAGRPSNGEIGPTSLPSGTPAPAGAVPSGTGPQPFRSAR